MSAPYMMSVLKDFRDEFERNEIELIVPEVHERLEEEQLFELIEDMDGVICGDDRFTERVLQKAKRLKVISKWGTGIDSIDLAACTRHGVRVCNTPNAFTDSVADSVMAYILAFARNAFRMDVAMKAGTWEKIQGHALCECTLGVIGVGNIGRAVARRAQAFGMTLLGNDIRTLDTAVSGTLGIRMLPLNDLLRTSDYISVNCDLNPTSRHLLNAATFSLMKPTAVVVNCARGPIIDELALTDALKNKKIAGAGLDVFEEEPLPLDSSLRTFSEVLLAPHNSNSSPAAYQRIHRNTINNLIKGLKELS